MGSIGGGLMLQLEGGGGGVLVGWVGGGEGQGLGYVPCFTLMYHLFVWGWVWWGGWCNWRGVL